MIQHEDEEMLSFCTSSCELIRRFAVEELRLESPCPRLITCWKLADTRHRTMTTRREQRDAITNLLNIKSLKSWNICCKQQPEALDRQDVQEHELVPMLPLVQLRRDSFLSDSGSAKARLPRHPGVTCNILQDDSET